MDPDLPDIIISDVVASTAGRDQGKLFYVVGTDPVYLMLVNGKDRTLEKPKRKNPKHIEKTSYVLSPEEMAANGRLKKALGRIKAEADK